MSRVTTGYRRQGLDGACMLTLVVVVAAVAPSEAKITLQRFREVSFDYSQDFQKTQVGCSELCFRRVFLTRLLCTELAAAKEGPRIAVWE